MAFRLFKKKKKDQSEHKTEKRLHLRISDVIRETEDAVRIVFDEPDGGLEYQPGQFLTLILNINGEKVRRAYSLCTSPYLSEKPAVAVKRVDKGLVSNFVNDTLKLGDIVDVLPPMGHFTPAIDKHTTRNLILIGGGSGITPLMGILKTVLHEESSSSITLIYANRDIDSIIFRDQLEQLKSSYTDRFNYVQSLDNPPANWDQNAGFLTLEKMKELITTLPDWNSDTTLYYVCGPQGLMNLAFEAFESLKLDHHRTFKESFLAIAPAIKDIVADNKAHREGISHVQIKYDGEEHEFDVPFGKSILETALAQNIDLPYSCQSGLCTACMGKCLEGEVDLSDAEALSEEERAEGYVLTCVGKPLTDRIVIEI
ncbi:MAG: ferredoxin--NADP reductase [Bacteroidetes bacterium]|nr:ferredoxin--NADP reductase [Bacteroidota bacterium]MDA1121033.1 ferredoxin--NADP reductase [Bacteroidota bacterium]